MDKITLGTKKVSIEFPGVKALSDCDFEISTGMIHAVMGANGAGKSTLMKVLAGSNPGYTGDVLYNGKVVEVRTPAAAKKLGIQIVYQEVDMALIPSLSVAENVMFNETVMNMKGKLFMNYAKIRKDAREVLARLNVNIDVRRPCSSLSLAEKQMVLIARAIQNTCNFLILDEPTAPLSDTETAELFRVVRHLRETENIAIIFITHRIHEVLQICDSYTVMRNGEIVDTTPITSETTSKEIVDKMLGRSFDESFPKEVCDIGEKSFVVEHLTEREGRVKDVSLYVRKGEIVAKVAEEYVKSLSIKTPSVRQRVANLSGGNQQKVVVAKWLNADADVYIFDEPTKGVDVGAKQEIFHLINEIAKQGHCVIYATCENSELLSITDRMYVMFDGRITAELETAKTSEDEIMHYATGATTAYAAG